MAALVSRFLLGVRKAANDAGRPCDSADVLCSGIYGTESTDFSFELQNTCSTFTDNTRAGYSGGHLPSIGEESSTSVEYCASTGKLTENPVITRV